LVSYITTESLILYGICTTLQSVFSKKKSAISGMPGAEKTLHCMIAR